VFIATQIVCAAHERGISMMKKVASALLGASALSLVAAPALAVTATTYDSEITQAQVEAAQAAWGEALVQISTDYAEGGIEKARATAEAVIDAAYGYEMGPVLFKPTLTVAPHTFRTTREGALAYFVGHDEAFPEDTGFALNGWTAVEIENAAIFISGDTAKTMGNVHITDADGNVTTVDKTWGFQRDEAGDLRIVLHHSSLPFATDEGV
jgi:hypothetical protein